MGTCFAKTVVRVLLFVCCRGGGRDVAADERSAAAHSLMAAPVDDTLLLAYPDVYDITQPDAPWVTAQGDQVSRRPRLSAIRKFGYCYVVGRCNWQDVAVLARHTTMWHVLLLAVQHCCAANHLQAHVWNASQLHEDAC